VGVYRLGLQAAVVGSAAARLRRPDEMVQATLHAVRSRTGESVGLAVLSGDHSVTVARSLSREPLRFNFEIGGIFPVHASAGGKVLLSSLTEEELRRRFGHRKLLTRYTDRTITHVDRLIEHLDEVRRQGYAIDDEECSEGQRCICVPVRIGERPARHALGVAAPAVRADVPRLLRVVDVLRAGAADLSAALAMDVYG
jgi:DNA-binding IclR family transcriptional regulator